MAIGIVLLAAGYSRRMQQNKLHLPWRQITVLQSVLDAFHAVEATKVAVVNGTDSVMEKLLEQYGYAIVYNRDGSAGQGDSTSLGAAMCQQIFSASNVEDPANNYKTKASLDGILFSVADQPMLSKGTIQKICSTFDSLCSAQRQMKLDSKISAEMCQQATINGIRDIVRPMYGTNPGNPVVFGNYWFSELENLKGDVGGRLILNGEGKECITYIEAPAVEGTDIDTPDVYAELFRKFGQE